MITIQIDEGQALDMLLDRLKIWTEDEPTYRLYEEMYQNYLDGGVFESMEFDVMSIVDNDYINYCSIVSFEDINKNDLQKLLGLYNDGYRDISCEEWEELDHYSFIEAVNEADEMILFRW